MEAAADLAGPAQREQHVLLVVLQARLVGLETLHVGEAVGIKILEQRRERLLQLPLGDAFENGNIGMNMDFEPHGERPLEGMTHSTAKITGEIPYETRL